MNVITTNTLKRVESFDIARGFCILLMVMGHAGFGMEFHKIIHTFHMPIFFFISGYFYRPGKYSGFCAYFVHLVRTLLVPYMIFAIFYELLHIIYTHDFSIRDFLIEVVSSNHNRLDVAGSLWFLLCLFTAKMLYFLIDRLVNKEGTNIGRLTFLIFTISLAANCLRKVGVILPFCLDSALSCLLSIHIGYLLYKNKDNQWHSSLLSSPWLVFILFIVLFVIATYFNTDINVRRNRFGIIPLYWISCFCGIFIILNISSWLDKCTTTLSSIIKSVLGYWGRESLVFLIFNELMLFFAGVFLQKVGIPCNLIENSFPIHIAMVIIAMFLLSVCAYFANKKYFKYLFGKC